MTASLDEAFSNFTFDAPASLATNFYLLLGDNAISAGQFSGDIDAYQFHVDRGSTYTIVALDNTNGFQTDVVIYDRNGSPIYSSIYRGNYTGITFNATDTIYYVGAISQGPGIYTLRAENNSITESNGIGEFIAAGNTYRAALDYTSDSDHFLFYAEAGHNYEADFTTNITDLFLKISLLGTSVYTPISVTGSAGVYTFSSSVTGTFDLAVSANSFTSTGAYAFKAFEITPVGNTINGTSGDESILGTTGNDSISGNGGNDTIAGGSGADTITATSGKTYLRGDVDFATDGGSDSISGGSGADDINGNMGNDTAHGNDGDDWVVGGKDNDLLYGDAGFDIVYGNMGNDTVFGGDGNDWVRGGQGDDSVSGGAGDDWLWGDKGNDTISGGSGADKFHSLVGAGIDRVIDFNRAEGDQVILDGSPKYTLSQVGADTVIDMGNGDQMILVGVTYSTLSAGWIVGG